jgi:hypothetical protein
MSEVKVFGGPEYAADLEKRMKRHGISQGMLSRAMEPQASATQVTRWFTRNETRRVVPGWQNIQRIEAAMARLAGDSPGHKAKKGK